MSLGVATKTLPSETAALASAIEPLEYQPMHSPLKAVQGRAVVGHPKVVEVPSHLATHRSPKVGEFAGVTLLAEPVIDFPSLRFKHPP
jgi:hypothetical protein